MNKHPFAALNDLQQQLKEQAQESAKQAQQAQLAQQKAAQQRALLLASLGVNPAQKETLEDESQLFTAAMHGVKKIAPSKQIMPTPSTKNVANYAVRKASALGVEGKSVESVEGVSDTKALLNPVGSESILSFKIKEVPYKQFDALKSGKLRWSLAVDLHACTIEQARAAVLQIIEDAKIENQTVLKIVHGKGEQAIIKTCVNGWLKQHPDVLAFVSAPDAQGGTGAVLVMIKRISSAIKQY